MTFVFWIIAITMVVVAVLFLAVPILRAQGGRPYLVAMIVASIPVFGFGIYALIGAPGELPGDASNVQASVNLSARAPNSNNLRNSGSVASLIGGLRSRLEVEPDDAGGWLLLAQSYQHLGDEAGAIVAYQRAKALGKSDPRFELLEAEDISNQSKAAALVSVRGQVSLGSDLVDEVRPDDTVFIFAKESRDHRMPVAAIRRPAISLPIDFELTNAQAMIAGTDLANYESLVVTARISRSGLANDSASGWEAWSLPVSPSDDEVVDLVITNSGISKVRGHE